MIGKITEWNSDTGYHRVEFGDDWLWVTWGTGTESAISGSRGEDLVGKTVNIPSHYAYTIIATNATLVEDA